MWWNTSSEKPYFGEQNIVILIDLNWAAGRFNDISCGNLSIKPLTIKSCAHTWTVSKHTKEASSLEERVREKERETFRCQWYTMYGHRIMIIQKFNIMMEKYQTVRAFQYKMPHVSASEFIWLIQSIWFHLNGFERMNRPHRARRHVIIVKFSVVHVNHKWLRIACSYELNWINW